VLVDDEDDGGALCTRMSPLTMARKDVKATLILPPASFPI